MLIACLSDISSYSSFVYEAKGYNATKHEDGAFTGIQVTKHSKVDELNAKDLPVGFIVPKDEDGEDLKPINVKKSLFQH